MDPANDATNPKRLGVYIQPGIGTAYPELAKQVRDLYVERISKLRFLPSGWLDDVLRLIDTTPPTLVKVAPVFKTDGVTFTDMVPDFVKGNMEAAKVWHEMSEVTRLAQFNYAAGKVEEGRAVMDRANANAAFWNNAYDIAVWIRDAPGNAVNAVGNGVMSFAGSFLMKTWWIWALLGVGVVVWYNKGTIAKKVGEKVIKG